MIDVTVFKPKLI